MKKISLFVALALVIITTINAQTQFSSNLLINGQSEVSKTFFNADINNDGNIDVVYGKTSGTGIYWMENDGNGNFNTEHTVSTVINAVTHVFVADFDNDNDKDILATSSDDTCLVWYENTNSGSSFIMHTINNNAFSLHSIFVIDMNKDNKLDIVYSRGDTLCLYLGNGNGTFQSEQVITDTIPAYCIYIDDINEDNELDILCSDYDNHRIIWLENDGSENFTNHSIDTNTVATCSVNTADINLDGKIDILATIEMSPGEVVWYENLGGGNFSTKNVIGSFGNAKDAISIDFDYDGDSDVVAGGYNYIRYYENNGSGSFSSSYVMYITNDYTWHILPADINNDGKMDFVANLVNSNRIDWYKNLYFDNLLVASYPFDGNADDATGNGYDGDITGHEPIQTSNRSGEQNSAYYFDGATTYTENSNMSLNFPFTFRSWINVSEYNYGYIFHSDTWDSQAPNYYGFSINVRNDGKLGAYFGDGNGTGSLHTRGVFTVDSLIRHTWYQTTVVFYSYDSIGIFINGSPVPTDTIGNQSLSTVNFAGAVGGIGAAGQYGILEDVFNGKIDDVEIYTTNLNETEINNLYQTEAPTKTACIIASFPFNGNADDVTGNGYDGDITGHEPELTYDRFGNPNSAYEFDGSNYIVCPSLQVAETFTISAWIKTPTSNNKEMFIEQHDSPNYGFWFGTEADTLKSRNTEVQTDFAYKWTHVVYVVDNGIEKIYKNGDLLMTNSTVVLDHSNQDLYIGGENDLISMFTGTIDDINIYNCALSSYQIDSLHELNGWTAKTNCEVVNYPLNGNADDISGNYYHGTISGSPQLTSDRFENPNYAYNFDTASYMYYNGNQILGLEEDLSFSAWINVDTLINDTSIISFIYDAAYGGSTIFAIAIFKSSNQIVLAHDTAANSPCFIYTGYNIIPHNNYHIVVLRDDANKVYKLYVNGSFINEYSYTESFMDIPVSTRGITISTEISTMAFDGIIDDVIIYNCLIDEHAVDSLFHLGGYLNNDNCQLVNWHLDGDSIDVSGNNYNGTFINSPQFTEDRFGNPNSAYIVDTNEFCFLERDYDLGFNNSFSYSFWLNIDSLINDTCVITIFIEDNSDFNVSFFTFIMNDTLSFGHDVTDTSAMPVDSTIEIKSNYVVEKNQFNHFVIIRNNDDKDYYLYVNNQLEGVYPYSDNPIPNLNSDRLILLGFPEPEIGINGTIDDVIIYNCIIDSATVDSLYNIGNWQCNDFSIDSVDVLDAMCGILNGSGEVYVSGGSGEYSYQWSNGSTDFETDSLSAGTNFIMVTDTVYGCTETYYFSIQSIGAPNIDLSSTDIECYGDNTASINSTVSNGTLPYVYNWSTGGHDASIQDLSAGTYELTVVDGSGCIATQSVEITQPEELELSFTSTNATCNTNDGTATVIVNGGISPYDVSWNTGSTSNPLTDVLAGAYDVTVSDNNGCTITGTAMISDNGAPTITIDSIIPGACNTNGAIYISISDTVNSPNYEWDGLPAASEDLLTAMPDFTHVLTVHDGNCTAMQDIYVDYILPEAQEICIVTVDTAIGANLIVWEKPISTEIAGYEIYRETSVPDEFVQIGYTPYDSLGVYVDSMAYPWIRSYKYKIATKDMCDMTSELSTAHKTIHVNLNIGYLSNTVNLIWDDYEGFPYTSFNILRFDTGTGWNEVNGSPIPNTLHSITADVLMTTSMFAITVDKPGNACLSTKTSGGPYNQSISNIDDYGIGTIIESVKPHSDINVYPNPADRFVIIEVDNSGLSKISIQEITGKVLINKEFNGKVNISTKDLTSGIYIIKIETNKQIITRKLVIE